MSSLAAARADNFYYPPEYRREHGSLNKFRGSHPLGVRAKRIKEGILVIRFEMPYKVFCTSCHEVIAKGVRFNAEKKCVGMYFSTKILEFTMRCCFCSAIFRIQTDPKNCEYTIVEGLHKKVEEFSSEDAQTLEFRSEEERAALERDPMLKLEASLETQQKQTTAVEQLGDLMALKDRTSNFDYSENSELRRQFRTRKAQELQSQPKNANFVIPLLPPDPSDNPERSVTFKARQDEAHLERRLRAVRAAASSLFPPPEIPAKPAVSSTSQGKLTRKPPRLLPAGHPALSVIVRTQEKERKPSSCSSKSLEQQRFIHQLENLEKLKFFHRRAQKNVL